MCKDTHSVTNHSANLNVERGDLLIDKTLFVDREGQFLTHPRVSSFQFA